MRPLDLVRRLLPKTTRRRLIRWTRRPPVGTVDLGQLRRLQPISGDWGGDRGRPLDRRYIERFLADHASAIRGRMLEVGDATYTRRFGGERVERADVLAAAPSDGVDWVVDLVDAPALPSATFDGVICTQTLQLVSDPAAAVATLHRVLRPGGTLLLTVPGISRLEIDAEDRWRDRWRFTRHGLHTLLTSVFATSNVEVVGHGNVLASIAFLHGLAEDELAADELDHRDERFDLLITARATRAAEAPR